MASDQSTVNYIVEQASRANDVRAKKMFGEYGVYCGERFIGVICDDQLFLKIMDAGKALLPDAEEGQPHAGAKPHLLISEEVVEDADRLSNLVVTTGDALPAPKLATSLPPISSADPTGTPPSDKLFRACASASSNDSVFHVLIWASHSVGAGSKR